MKHHTFALKTLVLCSLLCLLHLSHAVMAQDTAENDNGSSTPALVDQLSQSTVIVETVLTYDNGEPPYADYMSQAYQGADNMLPDWDDLINDELPDQRIGFVVAPDRVIINDLLVHPRFVKEYRVRDGNRTIHATPAGYALSQNGLMLLLDEPLESVKPYTFSPDAPGPYQSLTANFGNGTWWFAASPLDGKYVHSKTSRSAFNASWPALIFGKNGTPVTLTFNGVLNTDNSWKQSPADWQWLDADAMHKALKHIKQTTLESLPRVEIRLRSPSSSNKSRPRSRYGNDDDDAITEWIGTGVLLPDNTLLVLANFQPKVTARIEDITVYTSDNTPVKATFRASLRDHTGFLATLEHSAGSPIELAGVGFAALEDKLMLRCEIRTLGETRTLYAWQCRLPRALIGFRGILYPILGDISMQNYGTGAGEDTPMTFVFTPDGKLAGLPLLHRTPVSIGDDSDSYNPSHYMGTIATTDLLESILAQGDKAFDPNNRPLSESQEHQLAWLGVELQAMDPDLARLNGSAALTHGGQTGGIVTYIYDNSPAQKAGLQVGDILLRIHAKGQPKPIEIQVSPYDMGWGAQFSQALDQLDLDYFDQIPVPWGGAETSLTRALTDIGFGTPFTLDVYRDGKVITVPMTIEQGPPHYGSSPKYKNDDAGLTVRNLTYEVRRFFQLDDDDPGVIVSKVEKGTPAAIAGIKPFELIVAVNEQPIHTIKDFAKALAQGGNLQLSIKRMHVGRIVKIQLPRKETPSD